MIKLIPVSNSRELNKDLQQIYIDAFASDERREWHELMELLLQPNFTMNQVFDDQALIGLINFWDLQNFIFIEHFALNAEYRGNGIGSQVIKQITEENSARVVLEVEEPTDEYTRRRITFYGRLGFSPCENIYFQPPYAPDKSKVKMLLMSYPDRIIPLEFDRIKTQLYRDVYQLNEPHNIPEGNQ